jgi:hypothetical protein
MAVIAVLFGAVFDALQRLGSSARAATVSPR